MLNVPEQNSLHTGEVIGSIPIAPTIKTPAFTDIFTFTPSASSASNSRTKPEDDASTRGKSVDFVHGAFAATVRGGGYAPRVQNFMRAFCGAEVDMHSSMKKNLVTLKNFLHTLERGPL
jgi:hypothetical protein